MSRKEAVLAATRRIIIAEARVAEAQKALTEAHKELESLLTAGADDSSADPPHGEDLALDRRVHGWLRGQRVAARVGSMARDLKATPEAIVSALESLKKRGLVELGGKGWWRATDAGNANGMDKPRRSYVPEPPP